MRTWEPKKGDRVELLDGTFATVIEVWGDGLIILEREKTFIRVSILPDGRDQVILRVVDPAP